ncbi:MAG TPA: hypothetical protein VGR06_36300 [Actinophytocola sp.]|jgi:hypothetical protein|uniref:hypothetical protein n=1 Tax=Actinophytocola sp. TaxID=1872138 RepID=UPI002DFC30DB|nr:hypothetical protein [Actinophytocola sp.]
MFEFDFEQYATRGDRADAESWVEASDLGAEHKADLRQFIANFSALEFVRDHDELYDELEAADQVTLPRWLRQVRTTLAFVHPPMRVRVDDYIHLCPRSESVEKVWYELRLGYADEEQRELFHDEAEVYPIGSWWGTDRSYLAIDLKDHDDERIFEFASEDLLDNSIDGRPVRGSLYPVFDSYAQFLAHIVEGRRPDGTMVPMRRS